jgi:rubrerythrin
MQNASGNGQLAPVGGEKSTQPPRFHEGIMRAPYTAPALTPDITSIEIMNATHECIDVCNSLLRGELSAIETYNQALEKFDSETERSALRSIQNDHQNSASRLRDHIIEMGAEPAAESGAWGTFAKAVEGTAKMLGESPALAALKQGEEHGIDEYEEALRNTGVMDEIKTVIRHELLPPLSQHIAALDRLRTR